LKSVNKRIVEEDL